MKTSKEIAKLLSDKLSDDEFRDFAVYMDSDDGDLCSDIQDIAEIRCPELFK